MVLFVSMLKYGTFCRENVVYDLWAKKKIKICIASRPRSLSPLALIFGFDLFPIHLHCSIAFSRVFHWMNIVIFGFYWSTFDKRLQQELKILGKFWQNFKTERKLSSFLVRYFYMTQHQVLQFICCIHICCINIFCINIFCINIFCMQNNCALQILFCYSSVFQ